MNCSKALSWVATALISVTLMGCPKFGEEIAPVPEPVKPFLTKSIEQTDDQGFHIRALETGVFEVPTANTAAGRLGFNLRLLLFDDLHAELLITHIEQNGTTAPMVYTKEIVSQWSYDEDSAYLKLQNWGEFRITDKDGGRLVINEDVEELREIPEATLKAGIEMQMQESWYKQ